MELIRQKLRVYLQTKTDLVMEEPKTGSGGGNLIISVHFLHDIQSLEACIQIK